MKKQLKRVAMALTTGLLMSQLGHAAQLNTNNLDGRCLDAARQLNQIASDNRSHICSGDIEVAAAYIESAGTYLNHHKNEQALVSLTYGKNELDGITTQRVYCKQLSAYVRPKLVKIITIKSELELITHPVK